MKTKTRKLTATVVNRKGEAHHFFASSLGSWRVGTDVVALIASMKRENLPFNVWLVPLEKSADYEISFYAPQVEGAIWIGAYLDETLS
jgi:hypothetical protein